MPAPDYGCSLTGFSINLIARDIERALAFQHGVLKP